MLFARTSVPYAPPDGRFGVIRYRLPELPMPFVPNGSKIVAFQNVAV